MHKYLSVVHAESSRESGLRVQIPLVYTFHVLISSRYQKSRTFRAR